MTFIYEQYKTTKMTLNLHEGGEFIFFKIIDQWIY